MRAGRFSRALPLIASLEGLETRVVRVCRHDALRAAGGAGEVGSRMGSLGGSKFAERELNEAASRQAQSRAPKPRRDPEIPQAGVPAPLGGQTPVGEPDSCSSTQCLERSAWSGTRSTSIPVPFSRHRGPHCRRKLERRGDRTGAFEFVAIPVRTAADRVRARARARAGSERQGADDPSTRPSARSPDEMAEHGHAPWQRACR